jgi:hypothetical protein
MIVLDHIFKLRTSMKKTIVFISVLFTGSYLHAQIDKNLDGLNDNFGTVNNIYNYNSPKGTAQIINAFHAPYIWVGDIQN